MSSFSQSCFNRASIFHVSAVRPHGGDILIDLYHVSKGVMGITWFGVVPHKFWNMAEILYFSTPTLALAACISH